MCNFVLTFLDVRNCEGAVDANEGGLECRETTDSPSTAPSSTSPSQAPFTFANNLDDFIPTMRPPGGCSCVPILHTSFGLVDSCGEHGGYEVTWKYFCKSFF